MYVFHTGIHFNQKNNLILNICEARKIGSLTKAKRITGNINYEKYIIPFLTIVSLFYPECNTFAEFTNNLVELVAIMINTI
jgi:hypothetical protein